MSQVLHSSCGGLLRQAKHPLNHGGQCVRPPRVVSQGRDMRICPGRPPKFRVDPAQPACACRISHSRPWLARARIAYFSPCCPSSYWTSLMANAGPVESPRQRGRALQPISLHRLRCNGCVAVRVFELSFPIKAQSFVPRVQVGRIHELPDDPHSP